MKTCISFFFVTLLFVSTGISQGSIEGRVLNSNDGSPVPYVNIGIVDYMIGTVSDTGGHYDLPYRSEADSVIFSAIGFSTQKVSIRDLYQTSVVRLAPRTYSMEEIIVQERALGELKEAGHKIKRRKQSIGFGSTQLGTEIGAHIKIDKETVVEKAFFTFNRSRGDQLLFRVNLYQFDDEVPGLNLIPENVIIKSPDSAQTVSVDLSKYNIITDSDLLLSLEWVDAVSLLEDELQGISFRADESRRGSNTYLKTTSFAPFVKTDSYIKYRLGFYLTVRQED